MTLFLVLGALVVVGAAALRAMSRRSGGERRSVQNHQQTLETLRHLSDGRTLRLASSADPGHDAADAAVPGRKRDQTDHRDKRATVPAVVLAATSAPPRVSVRVDATPRRVRNLDDAGPEAATPSAAVRELASGYPRLPSAPARAAVLPRRASRRSAPRLRSGDRPWAMAAAAVIVLGVVAGAA
ncbi:MAG: hypothetical protein ACYDB3_08165, partial [Acidimicrobiales bacterium]